MTFRIVAGLAACALSAAPSTTQSTAEPSAWTDCTHTFCERLAALELSPAWSVAIVRGSDVLYLRGFGTHDRAGTRPTTADTAFYIASATKSFTGLLAAVLHERGAVDLDTTVAELLPNAAFHPAIDPTAIPARALFDHTHGIANDGPVVRRLAYSGQHDPEMLARLLAHHGPAANGREFDYGNLGYNVATLALDRKLGQSWKDLLREHVLEPLGMSSTAARRSQIDADRLAWPCRLTPDGFEPIGHVKHDANMHSAGGVMSTARDMARWLVANLQAGRIDGKQAVPATAIAATHRPTAKVEGRMYSFEREGYGMGWMTARYDDALVRCHFGGFAGFHSHVSFMPEHDVGVVVLVNTAMAGIMLADAVARYAYDTLRGEALDAAAIDKRLTGVKRRVDGLRGMVRADHSKRAKRSQDLPHPLTAYVGTYTDTAFGELEIREENGRLHARWGLCDSPLEVFDPAQNALRHELTGRGEILLFAFKDGAAQAHACRTSDGTELNRR